MERYKNKKRIDILMVERGLVETRARAQALIMAGAVTVDGKSIDKSGVVVLQDARIEIAAPPSFVSRGGTKLEHALDYFGLDVGGKIALDVGASTGGFTDCLLKRGVSRVYAVDVGYGQLDYRLRKDSRVVVMERINARYPFSLPEKADLATFDLSFISVEKVIPQVTGLLDDNGILLVLLKPQFEARKDEVGKGGVIRRPEMQARIIGRFISWAVEHRFRLLGLVASPILGASGNREFFIMLRRRFNDHSSC
jgi:23S rRNA (cytidine1920-2'-O)/16S rRNA (cytidine1409-2'-O)-methyltransferase